MGYAGAGLGMGLQQGLGLLSQSLMGIADNQRQRSMYEQALKVDAADRAENRRRYDESVKLADMARKEDQRRYSEAETVRRGTALAGAFEQANELSESGRSPQINPGRVYFTGSPLDNTLQQNQTIEAASGVPTVTAGAYNPENDVGLQRQKSLAEAYTGMGAGPRGQVTTPPRGTAGIPDDVKQRLIESANAQMGGDFSKIPEVLQTLAQRGAPAEYIDFLRSYYSGMKPSGGGLGNYVPNP